MLSLDAPKNTTRPSITGALEPGQRLVGNPGTWTGAPTVAYQWQHCAADGASCTDIDHATGSTYTLTTGDGDFRLRLEVTATNDAGSATAFSDPTALPNDDPRNDLQPTIKGTPEVGEQLTAYPGHWITHYGGSLIRLPVAALQGRRPERLRRDLQRGRRRLHRRRRRPGLADPRRGHRHRPGRLGERALEPDAGRPVAYPVNTLAPYIVGDPVSWRSSSPTPASG